MLPHDFPPWEAVYQQSRRWLMQHSPAAPHTAPDRATPATESSPAARD
jgi:hypothetical protein